MRYIDVNTLVPGEGTMTTTLGVRGEGKMPEGEHDATVVEVRGPGRPQLFEDGGQRVGPLLISTKQHRAVSRLSLSSGKSFNSVLRRAIALGLRRMVWDAKVGRGRKHALAEDLQAAVRGHLEAYRKNLLGVVRAAVVDAMAYDGEDGYDLDSLSGADGAIGVVFDHVEADWSQTLVEGGYPL